MGGSARRSSWRQGSRQWLRAAAGRGVIPSPHEGDSRRGFPKRGGCDSPWQTGRGFAMAAAIGVRGDYDAARLRELAKRSGDANQTRRLLALAAICDGGSRTEAAKLGGVGLQTVRDWVLAFNAEGPPGLVNGKAPGNAPLLTQAHRQALLEIVESGPIPAVHGVVRWRLIDLAQWVFEEFRISISRQTLSRELRALQLRK